MGWAPSFSESRSVRAKRPALALAVWVGLTGLAAQPARAEAGANVRLVLDGVILPHCDFVNVPGNLAINLPEVRVAASNLGFSCNLPDSAPVNIRITSQYGGLKREGADDVVPYAVAWSAAGPGEQALGSEPVTLTVPSGHAGEVRQGTFLLRATQVTDRLPAGRYSDRITYTISP